MIYARYGTLNCEAASMSLSMGITPDVGTLTLPRSAIGRIPKSADLFLSDGRRSITFRKLYLVEGSIRSSPGDETVTAQVVDRRVLWKWAFVSGVYNQRKPDGTANNERSAALLIDQCFSEMAEVYSPIITAPTDIYPPVSWDGINAAQAAQDLCDQLGLGISLMPDGKVSVAPLADWDRAWPAAPIIEDEISDLPPMKPGSIFIRGGPIVNEITFDLVPVGVEIDGTIRAIDDLSYKPAHGWGVEPLSFPNLAAGTYGGVDYTADEAKELASKTVWRWFAVDLTAIERKGYLPLLDCLSTVASNLGVEEHEPPYVKSDFAIFDGTVWRKVAKCKISEGFTLDAKAGIVKFQQPLFTVQDAGAAAGAIVAPSAELRAAYEDKGDPESPLWDGLNAQLWHYEYEMALGLGIAGTRLVRNVPELRLYKVEGVEQNQTELDAYSLALAKKIAATFETEGPQARTFSGIITEAPLGQVRAVRWHAGADGPTTRIEKNFDTPEPGVPAYEERLARRRAEVRIEMHERANLDGADASRLGLYKSAGGTY